MLTPIMCESEKPALERAELLLKKLTNVVNVTKLGQGPRFPKATAVSEYLRKYLNPECIKDNTTVSGFF